ncbi:DUF7504 family protein [Halopiger goleimassiliensis]|uniref:DUF7504 family protein n=1 Tax=Halopiger goleimassiliensis TaxID=1293048 RepID=UPI0006783175|nr:hypothetical protein [Halopiger goleimassiliensis]
MEHRTGSGGAVRVAQTLESFKRTGSNVLLVGTGAPDVHERACQRLCGTDDRDRYRLFVGIDGSRPSIHDHGSSATKRTIEYESGGPTPLKDLGIDVIEALDAFDADAGGLESADCRVCVDSLAPLLQTYDAERVFRLVHVLSSRIEQAQAIAHYHLPVGPDHDAVRLLEPLFDATVELRRGESEDEHRWHLHDREVRTDWIRL